MTLQVNDGIYDREAMRMNLGPETEYVEHKKSTGEHREACESIASMLNRHGRGIVYFGVRNDGEVLGQDVSDATIRDLGEEIERKISPKVRPAIDTLPVEGSDRQYIRVDFSGSDAPYSCDGRYRVRVNDRDVLMTPDELERAFAERANRLHPWDERPSERPVSDVNEATLRAFVERGRERGRISFEYEDAFRTLARLGLLTADGGLTNAADVLFCESRYVQLKAGLFANERRTEVLDMQHERGDLFRLVDRAELFIISNIRRRFVFTGARTREEVPEIPRKAIREALLNAYAHRVWSDYTSYVQVDVYMDKVDIISPGWFIPGQEPEGHLEGDDTSSATRNRLIASTLFKSGDIESSGLGMRMMRDLCKEAGVGLSYEHVKFGAMLTFTRPDPFAGAGADATGNVRQCPAMSGNVREGAEGLRPREAEALTLLGVRNRMTAAEVAAEMSLGDRQARRILAKLVEEGLARKVGSSVSTAYEVVESE